MNARQKAVLSLLPGFLFWISCKCPQEYLVALYDRPNLNARSCAESRGINSRSQKPAVDFLDVSIGL